MSVQFTNDPIHFGEYEGTRVLKKKLTKMNRPKVTQLFSGTGNET